MSDTNNNKLYQMLKISKSVLKAEKMMNKSLDYYREEILDEGVCILSNNLKKELITDKWACLDCEKAFIFDTETYREI